MNLKKLLEVLTTNKERNMKKYIAMLLSCILIMSQGTIIFAGDNDDTEVQYEMVEISDENMPIGEGMDVVPLTLYLSNVYTSIVKLSSTKVSIRAQAVCAQTVKSIKVTYILQKWNGSKWVDVASATSTSYDVSNTHKSYSISGLSSGKYRCKANAQATGYNGYSESLVGYSSSISL